MKTKARHAIPWCRMQLSCQLGHVEVYHARALRSLGTNHGTGGASGGFAEPRASAACGESPDVERRRYYIRDMPALPFVLPREILKIITPTPAVITVKTGVAVASF